MKVLVLLVMSLCSTNWAAPLLNFTPAEYKVFQAALAGGKPLYLQSALPLLTMKNVMQDRTVYLNIGGKEPYAPYHNNRKYFSDHKFSASRDKTSFQKLTALTGNGPSNFIDRRPNHDYSLPIYRNELANLTPISKRLQFIKTQNRRRRSKRDAKEPLKVNKEAQIQTVKTIEEEEARNKRQSEDIDYEDYDYEEEPVRYAEELGFGLSTAGGVLGGAVGGYLDTTGVATLKLIRSLESLSLIALSQLDDFLDRQEEDKKKANEAATATSNYSQNILVKRSPETITKQ